MDLITYIQTDPDNLGLAPFILSGSDAEIARRINAIGTSAPKSRLISARGILAEYPGGPIPASAVLDKLEAAATSVPALKWIMSFLHSDGIDIGNAATQAMLDQLALGGVLTTTESDGLKALGISSCSWGDARGFGAVTHEHVGQALRG